MIAPIKHKRIRLGQIVATPAALEALKQSGQTPIEFLARHRKGDWGDVCGEDWQTNDDAVECGDRLLSAYKTRNDVKLWIITEWDRSATTILLPEEY